jgi:hypothetical protein
MTNGSFKSEKKALGLITIDNYYHSPWNQMMNELEPAKRVTISYEIPDAIIEAYLEELYVKRK